MRPEGDLSLIFFSLPDEYPDFNKIFYELFGKSPFFLGIEAIFCLTIKLEFVKSPYEFVVLVSHLHQGNLYNNPINKRRRRKGHE